MVGGVVGVGGFAADDVEDGGVGVVWVVDGAVAVGGGAVGCPEDGGELFVGDVFGGVLADGHAAADGWFHDHADVDGWWEWDFVSWLWLGGCGVGLVEECDGGD